MSEQRIALRKIVEIWDNCAGIFEQINAEIRPKHGEQLFFGVEDPGVADSFQFEMRPATLYVPERASSHTTYLYIVLKGRISVRAQDVRDRLRTTGFATEIAYFREKLPTLQHVYGAHYDYAPSHRAHPLFHAQLKEYGDRSAEAAKHFSFSYDGVDDNSMKGILRTARLPCAQLDVFSTLLQVAADHLIDDKSSAEQLSLLEALAAETRKIQGIGDILGVIHEAQCMRGSHWYPRDAV